MNNLTTEVRALYAAIGRGEVVQFVGVTGGEWFVWSPNSEVCLGSVGYRWQIKPHTVTITYPAPMREVGFPDPYGRYGWYPTPDGNVFPITSGDTAIAIAAAGNLFHTREDAEAAALARREAK